MSGYGVSQGPATAGEDSSGSLMGGDTPKCRDCTPYLVTVTKNWGVGYPDGNYSTVAVQ